MIRTAYAALLAAFVLAALTPAQQSLGEIRAKLDADRETLFREHNGRPAFEAVRSMGERHAGMVAEWLATVRGPDAVNGRLLLADIHLNIGQEDRARAVLKALDVDSANALGLAAAAEMAGMLGMPEERARWLDAAIAKDASLDERMSLAMFVMTRLVEVDRGEAIFAAATEAAPDDEARAKIGWYHAAATRAREDVEDGAFEDALDKLGKRYPDTYWGGVARDRRKAFDLEPGSPAIPFAAKTLDGEDVALADFAGSVLLLDFWAAPAMRGPNGQEALGALAEEFSGKGLRLLGVALDTDRATAEAAAKRFGKRWPQVFDGRGFMTDLALRYGIEQAPRQILIGKDGKIAELRIYLGDADGVRELREAIARALSS